MMCVGFDCIPSYLTFSNTLFPSYDAQRKKMHVRTDVQIMWRNLALMTERQNIKSFAENLVCIVQ